MVAGEVLSTRSHRGNTSRGPLSSEIEEQPLIRLNLNFLLRQRASTFLGLATVCDGDEIIDGVSEIFLYNSLQ